jgi:hypothetical protein
MAAITAALLAACGGGNGGYSEEFRTSFMASCEASSDGQTAYCQCALDHLEANGPENEEDITAGDQQAAIEACQGEVTG